MSVVAQAARFATWGPPIAAADALSLLPAHVVEPLVGPTELRAAVALGRKLPPIWRTCMLEVRLTGASPRADFMACVADVDRDREVVSEALAQLEWADLGTGEALLRAWAGLDGAAARAVPIVWLEWDMPEAKPALPLSSACLDFSLLDAQWRAPDRALQLEIASWLLGLTCERTSTVCLERGLRACLRALPSDARLMHIAPLQARGLDRLRLTLGLLPSEVTPWLRAIEWPGDVSAVAAWLAKLAPPWERIFFQVELGEHVHPHLSVETRVIDATPGARDPWSSALRLFQDSGLVAAGLAGALTAWPGATEVLWQGEPAALARSSYVKLVLNAGVASEVKAYLGISRQRSVRSSSRSA